MVGLLLLLGACASPSGATDTEGWTEWSWTDTGTGGQADVEEAARYLEEAVSLLPTLVARPVLDAHEQAMSFAEDNAPDITTSQTETLYSTYWMGIYRTERGVVFNGPLSYWRAVDEPIYGVAPDPVLEHYLDFEDRDGLWSFEGLGGQADIFAQHDELDFDCTCYANTGFVQLDDGSHAWFSQLGGLAATWDEGLVEGTWMEGGNLRPEIDQFYTELDDTRTAELKGSLMWAEEDRGLSMLLHVGATAGVCEAEEVGIVQLFTPATGWVRFTATVDEACSLCLDEGEHCVDLLPTLSWKGAPL